jgi:foldase protein PrsA
MIIAGCGAGSSGWVAKVGGAVITTRQFDHWMGIATSSAADQRGAGAVVLDPPNFTRCVAQQRRLAPKPAAGQPAPTDAVLIGECEQEYERLKLQVVQFLISAAWVRAEAKREEISLSAAEIARQLGATERQSSPGTPDQVTLSLQAVMTPADFRFRAELDVLTSKLRAKVSADSEKVSRGVIAGYYELNRQRFAGQSLAQATPLIARLLTTANRQRALDRFLADFHERWKQRTVCQRGYVTRDCGKTAG